MQLFEQLVDVTQMQPILQQALTAGTAEHLQITACAIQHVHYYTSRKDERKARLNVCYQLQGVDSLRQSRWTHLLYGRARADGASGAEFAQAQQAPTVLPMIGPPLLHLPDQALTLWGFPNDPCLPHLPLVVDGERVKPYLPHHGLPTGWATQSQTQPVTAEVIHYYPEERCTVRYHIDGGDAAGVTTLIGKTFSDERGEQIYARMQAAWQLALAHPQYLRVAQPLGYTPAIKTIWMRHESGTPLLRIINADNAEGWLTAVARGLVTLQRGAFPQLTPLPMAELVAELQSKMQKVGRALPTLAPTLQALVAQLAQEAAALPPGSEGVIHGDFHIRQLLADQGTVIFLDFDEFALGDPLQDVANFMVDLYFEGLPLSLVQTLAHTFVQAYAAAAEWPVTTERLLWHVRYQFLLRAYRAYRQYRLDLFTAVQQILGFIADFTPDRWSCIFSAEISTY